MVQTAQGRFQRIQIATVQDLLSGVRPPLPAPIETEAFRRPLRPSRVPKAAAPEPQLSLNLPIIGGGKRRSKDNDVEEHFSGLVLASIAE